MSILTGNGQTVFMIGITGGIGSGKSTVSRFLSQHMHLPLVDIDVVCRKLLEPGQPGLLLLRQHVPDIYFDPEGKLDRRQLREAIFRDADLREAVNNLLHPLALDKMKKEVALTETGVVLVDVPLLYEAGWATHFQRTVVVFADITTCCQRVMKRDAVNPDDVVRSIHAQQPLPEKAMRADHVIDNSGCWLRTRLQAVHLAQALQNDWSASWLSQENA